MFCIRVLLGIFLSSALWLDGTSSVQAQGLVLVDQKLKLPSLSSPITYSLYLPEDYCDGSYTYPILYLLHGYGGTDKDWLGAGKVGQMLDKLILSDQLQPMIVVMPSAAKSWYVNSSKFGNYETALSKELPELLEAKLSNLATREGRAVAGLSMGGYGALKFAFGSPETFSTVAALSPAIFPNIKSTEDFSPLQVKLFAGAFEDPFSTELYNEENVFSLVRDIVNPPATYLSVGDDDWFGLYEGTFSFYKELRDQKIAAELRITNGNHDWKLWAKEIEPALIFIGGKLAKAEEVKINQRNGRVITCLQH